MLRSINKTTEGGALTSAGHVMPRSWRDDVVTGRTSVCIGAVAIPEESCLSTCSHTYLDVVGVINLQSELEKLPPGAKTIFFKPALNAPIICA